MPTSSNAAPHPNQLCHEDTRCSLTGSAVLCRVITWEPVPHFRAFLEYNRQLNRLEDLVDIRDTAVAEVSGVTYDLTVPQRGIWGTAGIGGLNIDG